MFPTQQHSVCSHFFLKDLEKKKYQLQHLNFYISAEITEQKLKGLKKSHETQRHVQMMLLIDGVAIICSYLAHSDSVLRLLNWVKTSL